MREKIIILIISAFLFSGIKAIPKDSVNYNFKAGVISPYCFKYTKRTMTYSWPFNSGFTLGLDASRKNFSVEFSLDHSSFRRISLQKINDSLVGISDIPFKLTQVRFFPKYRILHSGNSSLNIGCGFTMAHPSRTYDNNNPGQSFYLSLGNGICWNIDYSYKLPKRRLGLFAGINYEKLNHNPLIGPSRSKYDNGQFQDAPIYMVSLGIKYGIGRKKK